MVSRLVYGLFLLSGATALVYQVAWTRSLSLIFGASFQAIAVVLAAFMGGLAAGGFVFGRVSERVRRPLRLYGILEIGIAAAALALPALLGVVDRLYVSLAMDAGAGTGLTLLRVALAFAVLLVPTFLMGGTLPVLVKLLARSGDDKTGAEIGGRLSRLYAVNTLGAVIGTVAAGFVLLPALGVGATQVVAVVVSLAVGVVAILAGRGEAGEAGEAGAPKDEAPEPVAPPDRLPLRLAFLGTAVAGFGALALEVMWSRAIAVATGSTTYGFTVMLAAFLTGIAGGSALYAAFPLRRVRTATKLGATLALVGIAVAVASRVIPGLPALAVDLNLALYGGFAGVRAGTTLLLSFAVMLVPSLFMGAAFPMAGEARARLRSRAGESVGDLVALNTTGAIAGSLLAGFVLIPVLGLQQGVLKVASFYLAFGLAVLLLDRAAASRRRTSALTVAALLSVPLALSVPGMLPTWDVRALAEFQNNNMARLVGEDGSVDPDRWREQTSMLYYREGRGSTVSVIETAGNRAVIINGKSVATDSVEDMQHEYLLGHLPVLLHPRPRSALVIGLGAGLTLGGVVADEGIERIVVVEIEPAVIPAARLFDDLHDAALDDPRVELVIQDGRNYLLTTSEKFDVITADPIHPWAQGAAYLYTTEYFDLIAGHLAEGGVACQWLPLYELSPDDLRCVAGTFADSFPDASLWQATFDALLIGSTGPLAVDAKVLRQRLKQPKVERQLSRIGLDGARSLLAEHTMGNAGVRRFAEGGVRNTDDNLHLEFSSPKSTGSDVLTGNIALVDSFREAGALSEAKSGTIGAALARRAGDGEEAENRLLAALEVDPDYGPARHMLARLLFERGLVLRASGDEAAAQMKFAASLAADPGHAGANFERGASLIGGRRFDEALPFFRRALERRPRFPEASQSLGQALTALGRHEEALEPLRAAVPSRGADAALRHNLGFCLLRTGQTGEAIAQLRMAHILGKGRVQTLLVLAEALAAADRHRDAIDAVRDGLEKKPGHPGLTLRLAWLLSTAPPAELRDGAAAVRLVANLRFDPAHPLVLDTGAAALAETGRFPEAAEAADRAAAEADRRGDPEHARKIRERAASYRSGKPWRE